MANITFKAPSSVAPSTNLIMMDGTVLKPDAFGYLVADSKYTESLDTMGFVNVFNVNDPLPTHLYTAMADTTTAVILPASLIAANSVINMTGTLGAGATLTFPTVAALAAAIPGWTVGMTHRLRVINTSAGNFAWTLTTAATITMTGTMTVAQNTWRDFLITYQSATTATCQAIGTGTQS